MDILYLYIYTYLSLNKSSPYIYPIVLRITMYSLRESHLSPSNLFFHKLSRFFSLKKLSWICFSLNVSQKICPFINVPIEFILQLNDFSTLDILIWTNFQWVCDVLAANIVASIC